MFESVVVVFILTFYRVQPFFQVCDRIHDGHPFDSTHRYATRRAALDVRHQYSNTLLHEAAKMGHAEAMQALLGAKALGKCW